MKKIGNNEADLTFIKSYKIDKEEDTIYMWHANGEVYLAPYTEENVRRLNLKMDRQARHSSIKPRTKLQQRYSDITSCLLGVSMYQAYEHRDKASILFLCLMGILKIEDIISVDRYSKNKNLVDKYKYFLEHKDEYNRFIKDYTESLKAGLSKKAVGEIDSKLSEGETPFTFNSIEMYKLSDLVQLTENINLIKEESVSKNPYITRGRKKGRRNR